MQVYLYYFFNISATWGLVAKAKARPFYPWERDPVPIV